jgi:hypothetical protein
MWNLPSGLCNRLRKAFHSNNAGGVGQEVQLSQVFLYLLRRLLVGGKADKHGILSGDAGFLWVDHVGLGNADGADLMLRLFG